LKRTQNDNELKRTQNELDNTKNILENTKNELKNNDNELKRTQNELENTQNELKRIQNELEKKIEIETNTNNFSQFSRDLMDRENILEEKINKVEILLFKLNEGKCQVYFFYLIIRDVVRLSLSITLMVNVDIMMNLKKKEDLEKKE